MKTRQIIRIVITIAAAIFLFVVAYKTLKPSQK